VLVTHHLGDILPEIERVILMRGGRIVGMGRARVADGGAAERVVPRAGADWARRGVVA